MDRARQITNTQPIEQTESARVRDIDGWFATAQLSPFSGNAGISRQVEQSGDAEGRTLAAREMKRF